MILHGNRVKLTLLRCFRPFKTFVATRKAKGCTDTEVTRDATTDGDRGRIETRTTTVINDVGWLQECRQWPRLKAVVMVDSSREINGKTKAWNTVFISHHWS
jgi:hypothetical protein